MIGTFCPPINMDRGGAWEEALLTHVFVEKPRVPDCDPRVCNQLEDNVSSKDVTLMGLKQVKWSLCLNTGSTWTLQKFIFPALSKAFCMYQIFLFCARHILGTKRIQRLVN